MKTWLNHMKPNTLNGNRLQLYNNNNNNIQRDFMFY